MKTGPYVWLAVLAASGIPHVSAAQPGASPTLRSVQAAVEGDVTIVTVTADGPLPVPASGVAETPPPRLFFDFPGVNPIPGEAGRVIRLPGAGAVGRIRVGLFSTEPNVTRVVLDVKQVEPFTVSVGDQVPGRIRIVVGAPAAVGTAAPKPAPSSVTPPSVTQETAPPTTAPAAPLTREPPAAVPPAAVTPPPAMVSPLNPPPPPLAKQAQAAPVPLPASPTRRGIPQPESAVTPLPPAVIEAYRRQLVDAIERIESHRSVIAAIDLERYVTVRTLEAVNAELKNLQARIETVKPSNEMRTTHDLLLASCALGVNAVTLRIDAERRDDAAGRRNAASAAAGALMLLDRACVVLGCATKP